MLLDHYVSAMDSWKGRIDSETDYDAFRWHQWVQPIDLNDDGAPFTGKLGFAFIGFCSDKGVARNKGRTGTALAPDFVRGQMSGLPCTFSQEVKLYDAGDIRGPARAGLRRGGNSAPEPVPHRARRRPRDDVRPFPGPA